VINPKRYKVNGRYDDGEDENGKWVLASAAEEAIAERDARIAELEAAIMKISEITEREEQGPGWTAKIILALDAAIKKAEKLVAGEGR
jgi:hypothetical protein